MPLWVLDAERCPSTLAPPHEPIKYHTSEATGEPERTNRAVEESFYEQSGYEHSGERFLDCALYSLHSHNAPLGMTCALGCCIT
jgi:hypothetical protein